MIPTLTLPQHFPAKEGHQVHHQHQRHRSAKNSERLHFAPSGCNFSPSGNVPSSGYSVRQAPCAYLDFDPSSSIISTPSAPAKIVYSVSASSSEVWTDSRVAFHGIKLAAFARSKISRTVRIT